MMYLGPGLPKDRKPAVSEFIDPVFAKTSRKRSFSLYENERFLLVIAKTGSINSGTELFANSRRFLKVKFSVLNNFKKF
jgi:hypothetical protein